MGNPWVPEWALSPRSRPSDRTNAGRCNTTLALMDSGLRGVGLSFSYVCGERNNPTPFEKFGCGGSRGGAGQGADSAVATPRTHAGLGAPQLPWPLGPET